ncbi:MAG: glycosyltransferase family 2 protein [Proteobacteria bacterium]|nr:glycosyltransferase family 2 protein [Pseudomonadota bacterium]MBU1417061.1 glycosyltransferase family 2 protein [Pseudomonadota bacterium]MBU1453757.1 glycosyltransferase family 2 protein [Pseudomonadota bacterium]
MTGISVIIPTYNRAAFLGRALKSVQEQTLACAEVIVVDDGSTDNTGSCVSTFASQCSFPVRYVYQENSGPAAARNRGMQEARFSVFAFLDSDDHWQKKKCELQLAALEKRPEMMISHTRERWQRCGVHLNQKKIHQAGDGDIFSYCLRLCTVGMSTIMVRRELFEEIGLFNEKMRCCEDYDLWLRISSRYPFLLVDMPLTVKEGGRDDQVSWQYRVGMDTLRIKAILDLIRKGCLSEEQVVLSLEELQRKCRVYGQGCIKHKRPEEGQWYLHIAQWTKTVLDRKPLIPFTVPANPVCLTKPLLSTTDS